MKAPHSENICSPGPCPFHSPSDHHMRDWPITVRYDRWCMTERICEHGCGHPDPDSIEWMRSVKDSEGTTIYDRAGGSLHGCCGCC